CSAWRSIGSPRAWRRAAATIPSACGTSPTGRRSASCGGMRPTSTPWPSARTARGWLRLPGTPRCAPGARSGRRGGRGRKEVHRSEVPSPASGFAARSTFVRSVGDLDDQRTDRQTPQHDERNGDKDPGSAIPDEQEDQRYERSSREGERQGEVNLLVAVE